MIRFHSVAMEISSSDHPEWVEYTLDGNVSVEAGPAVRSNPLLGTGASMSKRSGLPQIRFQPDGGIDESSVETVRLLDREGASL